MTDQLIQSLALIRRRSDIERSEFRHHYETIHAPLAIPIVKPHRYVRHHVVEDVLGEIDFDVVTSFTFASLDAAMAAQAASDASDALRADERTFMDVAAQRVVAVAEHEPVGEPSTQPRSLWVLGKAAGDRSEFLQSIDTAAIVAPDGFAVRRDGIDMGDGLAFDVALQLDDGAALDWLQPLVRGGAAIWVFRTETSESAVQH